MNLEHFGDSYDVVKQSLLRWLAPLGPWAVHPMFTQAVPDADAAAFSSFLGAPLVSRRQLTPMTDRRAYLAEAVACRTHLFLDPDTGLKLDVFRGKKAPAYLFGAELREIVLSRPERVTLVFDQSLSRSGAHAGLVEKLAALRGLGLFTLAYESHACFLLASGQERLVGEAEAMLTRESRLPGRRILLGPQNNALQPTAGATPPGVRGVSLARRG